MKIEYKNTQTQKICTDIKKATKYLGKPVAEKLMDIINAIESFPSLRDFSNIPQYRLHPLVQNRKNEYSIVISKGTKWRLIISPKDENGNVLTDRAEEKQMLSKAVIVLVKEVSEHYGK